ncbi:MAG TPA: hypothetical protein PKY50_08680 [Candidatus Competibacter sp.]|nr:hypothetical protein [Candidatus Competibacter sp.]
MKSTILAVPILIAAMSGTTALAQDIPATTPSASTQSDPAMGDDFAENRQACLQQARQTADPQERQRLIQQCRQDFPRDAKTMPTPATPPSAPAPQIPDATDSASVVPDSAATPASPDTQTAPSRTLSPSAMSPEERREQRRLQREQRRLARRQAMQTEELDDDAPSANLSRGNRPRAWLAQSDNGYARMEPSAIDDDVVEEPARSSDLGEQEGNDGPSRAGNWQGDYAGPANRGQRIRRLEQRLEVIEDLLRQILANQRRLLNR